MKSFLRRILRILDGSPSTSMATSNRQRGQSMLELALMTPLLAILVAGAVEVGWYTNHWLTLLEVTRVGARSATFLQNELSPLEWRNEASVVPAIQVELMGVAESDVDPAATNARDCESYSGFGFYSFISCLTLSSLDPLELNIDFLDPIDADNETQENEEAKYTKHPANVKCEERYPDFPDPRTPAEQAAFDECYDENLDRDLLLSPQRDLQSYDDIVVSVFSIQTVNNAKQTGIEPNNEGGPSGRPVYDNLLTAVSSIDPDSDIYKITYDLNDVGNQGGLAASDRFYPPGLQNIVVGRYPTNANECTHKGTSKDDMQLLDPVTDTAFENDPFDYLEKDTGAVTTRVWGENEPFPLELSDADGSPLADSGVEFQRGFAYSGQHRIDDPNVFCYGSEFSIADVERLMNMPGFIEPDIYDPPFDTSSAADTGSAAYQAWATSVYGSQDERAFFEPQGMTLVEVFWEHDMLLNFGFFRPLKEAYGDGAIVIALWSAFPLPSSAPNILYQLP